MKKLGLALIFISTLGFAASTLEPGTYTYVAPGENYRMTAYTVEVKGNEISLPTAEAGIRQKSLLQPGADPKYAPLYQARFAGDKFSFFHFQADIRHNGKKDMVTIVRQPDPGMARLGFFIVYKGKIAPPLFTAYDASQADLVKKQLGQ